MSIVEVAEHACRCAGAYLADAFLRPSPAQAKTGRFDLVTHHDGAAERMIRQELTAAFPGSAVVGEEGGGDGDADLVWFVDPIDGTHNFARGIPLFCVSVGAFHAGRPVGGCVYDPVRDELFSADAGGLRRNGLALPEPAADGDRLPMVLTDIPTAGAADGAELDLYRYLLDVGDVRRIGSSALALAYVAAGRADIAANADVYPWDTAAGRQLVTAAGGGYVQFPAPRPGTPGGFVAWSPAHEPLGRSVAREVERITGSI